MTGPAVDLVAVGVARRALAAVVAEHPELTSAPSRARLAEHLPEIIAMPPRLDPDSADSTIVGVRMTPEMRDALDAEVSRQRALNPDVSIGRSNVLRGIVRRALLGSITTPAQTAPAAPAAPIAPVSTDDWSDFSNTRGAPAPSRPVASPAAPVEPPPVDLRQLPLRAHAAPVIVPHTSASGSSITSAVSNDNGVSPATPKHTRAPSRLDAAAVGKRLRALRDDEVARGIAKGSRLWSLRTAGATAGVSPPTIDKLMKGEPVKPEMLAKVAAILPPE